MKVLEKLNNLNGLQRVFLVAFLVCLGFASWGAMVEVDKANQGNSNYLWSINKDFDNPACLPYTTKPMSQLTKPDYSNEGGNCWHIYTHRYYNSDVKLPLTKESYESGQSIRSWKVFFTFLGIYSALTLMGFGLIFIAYKIGRWIYAGFKKAK